ncbi:TSUP family transporter [Salinibacterium sp. GXW1014]|uniref:TSUP family transporter n=1 Tax=Salinibacterium sp. GXW1014 TaxID=3377838 RepID=UPI00383AEE5F
MTPDLVFALSLLGITVGAFVQAATGMGFSLVSAPLLIMHLGPREGVAAVVVLAALSSLLPLARDGRHGQPGAVARLLIPTLLCTPLIAWGLADVDTRWLALVAGLGVIVAVGILASGVRWKWLRHPLGAISTGATSALLNVVGGVGGPPIGIYAANAGWAAVTTRANMHSFFIVQNLATALVLGIVLPGLSQLAALAVGTVLGVWLAPRVSAPLLRWVVLGISLIGGVSLVVGAL